MSEFVNLFEGLLKSVKDMSEEDFNCGHPVENFEEFSNIIKEDNIDANVLLYKYYLECFDESKENG